MEVSHFVQRVALSIVLERNRRVSHSSIDLPQTFLNRTSGDMCFSVSFPFSVFEKTGSFITRPTAILDFLLCFCSFRHLSSPLFVTNITAHNRVRYFCSRIEQIETTLSRLPCICFHWNTKLRTVMIVCVFNLSRSIYWPTNTHVSCLRNDLVVTSLLEIFFKISWEFKQILISNNFNIYVHHTYKGS